MTKSQLYQKVQALFPSELAVGDVVELREKLNMTSTTYYAIGAILTIGKEIGLLDVPQSSKLIRKNITLPMVLRKFEEVRKFHIHLDINSKGYLTYWESIDDDKSKQVDWILQENGKDLSLYDQSIELIKLVWEVLK